MIVRNNLQAGRSAERRRRIKRQPVQCRVDVGDRADKGHGGVRRAIACREGKTGGAAERNAVNAPIQGSAADIIKIAMINIYNKLEAGNYKTKMLLQVHDELVFDVYKPELDTMKTLIKSEMENAYQLSVPLDVDMDLGDNWLEAH